MTVGLFINQIAIDDFDDFLTSNPGIGGTEYMTLALAISLSLTNKYDVVLYTREYSNSPRGVSVKKVNDVVESLLDFDSVYGGIFILCPRGPRDASFAALNQTRIIIWNHCELKKKVLDTLYRRSEIRASVALSEGQMSRISTSRIRKITTIIGHFISTNDQALKNKKDHHEVCYIGSIYPFKHLDLLTRAWPSIVKKIPDARLYVIGTSKVYNENANVGNMQIADSEYEKEIIYPLKKHNVLDSVVFLGKLNNNEINKTLNECSVGVVNPVGTGETFCISALNFAANAIPVVGGNYGGLRTTIPSDCGYRVSSKRKLSKRIIRLLENEQEREKKGFTYYKFVQSSYNLKNFTNKWERLIDSVFENPRIKQKNKISVFLLLKYKIKYFWDSINLLKNKISHRWYRIKNNNYEI